MEWADDDFGCGCLGEGDQENNAVSSSDLSAGLDGLTEKLVKYFCNEEHCSDGENNQYPKCQLKHCPYRDRVVNELIDIIKEAD